MGLRRQRRLGASFLLLFFASFWSRGVLPPPCPMHAALQAARGDEGAAGERSLHAAHVAHGANNGRAKVAALELEDARESDHARSGTGDSGSGHECRCASGCLGASIVSGAADGTVVALTEPRLLDQRPLRDRDTRWRAPATQRRLPFANAPPSVRMAA